MTNELEKIMTTEISLGSIVNSRGRDWIVIPSEDKNIVKLKPLTGFEEELCGIFKPFIDMGIESVQPSNFPIPDSANVSDKQAATLLFDSARLLLRSGAGPLRSFGRISLKPRPYQLVPLLMALRQENIRLLIADDVGVGKTIEAGLVARELLDRGEINRVCVLCPPHLVEQWQIELKSKFHIDAEIIRSGTISRLEKNLPPGGDHSIFSYYKNIIVSLDFAKTDRRKASFIHHCPDFIIVDEAHTCSRPKGSKNQQLRYELISEIAQNPEKQMLLLTATPHSGIETSFLSILEFLKPEFGAFELENLSQDKRQELAKYFIQRRRADVKQWLGDKDPFPKRSQEEEHYELSKEYVNLFNQVYNFARGLILSGEGLNKVQQRGRYWSALAIIRAVMSSPKAAEQTLKKQKEKRMIEFDQDDINEELFQGQVYDPLEDEKYSDVSPSLEIPELSENLNKYELQQIRNFEKMASSISVQKDNKLKKLISIIDNLLKAGYHPVVFCRYVATAQYVANELKAKFKNTEVLAITGQNSEDERDIRLNQLKEAPSRILVATDCLSEGMNLQEDYSAVVHYDLPWNPNRLEQREGRIDRYGQPNKNVKTIILFGKNNPVDGAVLQVLIRKAITIHRRLGVTVPIPISSDEVAEALFQSLFKMDKAEEDVKQLELFERNLYKNDLIGDIDKLWDRAEEKEKRSRTIFAQQTIKPEEAAELLEETDKVLGSEKDVENFVKSAMARLNAPLNKHGEVYSFSFMPDFMNPVDLGLKIDKKITFDSSIIMEGVQYIGRNHPLVELLAQYVLHRALEGEDLFYSRCGVIRTRDVQTKTTLILYRARYLLSSRKHSDLLAEECFITGFEGSPGLDNFNFLREDEAFSLLETARASTNISQEEKQRQIDRTLEIFNTLRDKEKEILFDRADSLSEKHMAIRQAAKLGKITVDPKLPMDILGLYVLLPEAAGVK